MSGGFRIFFSAAILLIPVIVFGVATIYHARLQIAAKTVAVMLIMVLAVTLLMEIWT